MPIEKIVIAKGISTTIKVSYKDLANYRQAGQYLRLANASPDNVSPLLTLEDVLAIVAEEIEAVKARQKHLDLEAVKRYAMKAHYGLHGAVNPDTVVSEINKAGLVE
jgi:hypothetical protein